MTFNQTIEDRKCNRASTSTPRAAKRGPKRRVVIALTHDRGRPQPRPEDPESTMKALRLAAMHPV